jgi:hypothetical protein
MNEPDPDEVDEAIDNLTDEVLEVARVQGLSPEEIWGRVQNELAAREELAG